MLLVVIVLLILILVAAFKWASRPSNQDSPASHLILGFGERVRGVVRTLEDRLGFRLWPGGREEREGDEEEGKMLEVVVGVEGEGGEQKDEEEEDGEDSSDENSSMEGDHLRQTAKSGEKEEEKREEKSKSEEGQGEEKGGTDGERGGGEEAIALVGPEWEKSEGEVEESDVTIL